MTRFVTALILLAAASGITANRNHHRQARASAGSYSGFSNGQFYGGNYHAPDDGPPVFNRFGDVPAGPVPSFSIPGPFGSGGPFGGAGGPFGGSGAFAGSGAAFAGPGHGTYAPQFPFAPNSPPFPSPFEFNQFFQNYFKTLNDNLAAASRNNVPHSTSSSSASFSFDETPPNEGAFAKNNAYQRAAYEAAQKAFETTAHNRFGSTNDFKYYGPGSNGGAASASASLGPGGGHQSAHIYPENPNNPNVNTRFGSSGVSSGKPGTYGVSSSSYSASSNLGGKKTSYKEASTTINDNGKIRTYTVRD